MIDVAKLHTCVAHVGERAAGKSGRTDKRIQSARAKGSYTSVEALAFADVARRVAGLVGVTTLLREQIAAAGRAVANRHIRVPIRRAIGRYVNLRVVGPAGNPAVGISCRRQDGIGFVCGARAHGERDKNDGQRRRRAAHKPEV
jgi:hypothetical protein